MQLILFDIDGTLISSGGAGTLSLNLAFMELFSINNAFREISMAGKTDTQIIREGLVKHNLPCDNGVIPEVTNSYLKNLRAEIHKTQTKHLKPGIREALEILSRKNTDYRLGLLTGNLDQGARIKLDAFDLNKYFPAGAFGCDDEDRNNLLPVAVKRFNVICSREINYSDCIIVGDTPRDVHCAKPYGAFCIAVATGHYTYRSLVEAGADFVMEDLSDTDHFLKVLSHFK